MHIRAMAFFAMICGGLWVTAVSAMTVARPNGLTTTSSTLQLADDKDKKPSDENKKPSDKDKKRSDHEQKYSPGSDRHEPPANWHRYDRRPDDWSTRGCIMFGPVWWCP